MTMPPDAVRAFATAKVIIAVLAWSMVWAIIWRMENHRHIDYALLLAIPAAGVGSLFTSNEIALAVITVFEAISFVYLVLLYAIYAGEENS